MSKRRWAKLAVDYRKDPAIRKIARTIDKQILALWPAIIAESKAASSKSNPEGTIETTVDEVAEWILATEDETTILLDALQAAKRVRLRRKSDDFVDTIWITMTRYTKWQSVNGSPQERLENHRERQRQKKDAICREMKRSSNADETVVQLEIEKEREKENQSIHSSSTTLAATIDTIVGHLQQQMEFNQRQFAEQLSMKLSSSGIPEVHWIAAAERLRQRYEAGKKLRSPASVIPYLQRAAQGIQDEAGQLGQVTNRDHEAEKARRADEALQRARRAITTPSKGQDA